jgi:AraC-like DNA-binding protein
MEWIAPPRDLVDLVHTFYITRVDPGRHEDMMPAYSAQLIIVLQGSSAIFYPDREVGQSGRITFNAPMLAAAPMVFDGPFVAVNASLSALGWAALARLPVNEMHDCAFEARERIGEAELAPLAEAAARARAGEIEPRALIPYVETMIRSVIAAQRRKSWLEQKPLLDAIEAWLTSSFNPAIDDLYANVALGPRQVQRLCKRYYGVPPAQLVKRSRAIRAAMLLANENLPGELRDEVFGAYYDQAHLIHDIRRFTGRTPKRLATEPMAQDLFDPRRHGRAGKNLHRPRASQPPKGDG